MSSYIHAGGRLRVLIEVNCETDFVARNEDFQRLVRDLAMQVAGLAPVYPTIDSIPAEVTEQKKIKQLPGALDIVLDNLEKDHDFLLKGDVFTPDLIETWIDYKRTKEIQPVAVRPHPHEFELYFDL